MKTLIKFINGKEIGRKHGYANETDARNAAGSFLNDCTVHALERQKYSVEVVDTFKEIKKELNSTDDDIARMFDYKNKLSYSNSSAKTRIETALISFYLLIKKSDGKNI